MPMTSPVSAAQASPWPTLASQTLQHHLNKVAWWLDLQSEDSRLNTPVSTASVTHKQAAVHTSLATKGLQGTASRQGRPGPPAELLPTASTELFLQLEAASLQATGPVNPAVSCAASPTASPATSKQPVMLQAEVTLPQQSATTVQPSSIHAGLQQPVVTVEQGPLKDNRHEIGMPVFAAQLPGQSMQNMYSMLPSMPAYRQAAGQAEHAFSQGPEALRTLNSAAKHAQQAEPSCAKRAKQAEAHCKKHTKQDETPPPKAAEAALVREGSYAVAAQEAKARSIRQQQVLQQLAAQREQARTDTAASKQAAPEARRSATSPLTVLASHTNAVCC